MSFLIVKKYLARAHFHARSWARKCRIFCTNVKNNVEYSTLARSAERAPNIFRQSKAHKIFYLLHILDFLISFELIAVAGFEMCVFFHKKFDFFLKNFKFWKFSKKWRFQKKFKLQIALKNSLFKLWTNKKSCNEIL